MHYVTHQLWALPLKINIQIHSAGEGAGEDSEVTGGQTLLTAQYGGHKQQMLITGLAGGVRPLGQLFNVQ